MELITEVRSDLEDYVTTNLEGSTGDGIKIIKALGDTTVDMDQIPNLQQDNPSYLMGNPFA